MASDTGRIVALDTLRGLAILGILPVNVLAFAYPLAARDLVHFVSPAPSEAAAQALIYALCDAKFVTVFTFMFGVGLALQTREGDRPRARLLWRLCLLAAIGALHGVGLWHGDILFVYAALGIALMPLLRLPSWALATIGALLLAGTCVARLWALDDTSGAAAPLATLASLEPASPLAQEIAVFRDGALGELVVARSRIWRWMLLAGLGEWWVRTGAVMLLGFAACRTGVIEGASRNRVLRSMLVVGLTFGLPLEMAYGIVRASGGGATTDALELMHYVASLALAGAYVSGALSLPSAWHDRAPLTCCRAVGRVALTNYLLQSFLCTWVFYSYGLGLFVGLTRAQLLAVVLAVWSIQVAASVVWLRWFTMGPVEWAWRSATLRGLLPIRRARPSAVAVPA